MKRLFKGLFTVVIALSILITSSITCYAKSNLSVLKNNKGWLDLSYEDKCDTIDAMIQKIGKELDVAPIDVRCYEWPGSYVAAYNNSPWINQICVNISVFLDDTDATLAGETVEYHLVKVLAHEVRHSYQAKHMYDDTDYGRAVYASQTNYISYNDSIELYKVQFVEVDAETYAIEYANKYVKNGKLPTTKFIANNGKLFDSIFYANTYQDVKNALGTDPQKLLEHYNTFGINENRLANANDKIY